LDIFKAYGTALCLFSEDINFSVQRKFGFIFTIEKSIEAEEIQKILRERLIIELNGMLSMHDLYDHERSILDFSAGANLIEEDAVNVPNNLRKIFEALKDGRELNMSFKIPITLDPTFVGNTVDAMSYALAWVGFHNFAPIYKYIQDDNYKAVHVFIPIISEEKYRDIDLISLAELKPHHIVHEGSDVYMAFPELALLFHITHTETIVLPFFVMNNRKLSLETYTIYYTDGKVCAGSPSVMNLFNLARFMYDLKVNATEVFEFIDTLLQMDVEASRILVNAIETDNPDRFYEALRKMHESKVPIPKSVARQIMKYIAEINEFEKPRY